ncbi:GNAT family N-acetyltransferase [Paenibacillus sp. HW567]|uniref:GNAT family N-acetyltransferase n=1 Tax=Paenibacillus sp. HW567 TaxID=1034769 RepID=UPI000380C68E|nr:GNAT family N-acetyltransferase [Paenibacillus sp. HW567]
METKRLLIRGFKPEDWEDLHEYLSQEEVVKYEPYGVFDEKASRDEALRRSTDHAFWAVCLKDTGKVIGNLYFQQQEPEPFRTWELGYVFNSQFQGKGYAVEACIRLLEYGFGELQIRRVAAHCDPRNSPSWRLLERLRLRREGHFLQTGYFKTDADGQPMWHDTYAYGVLGQEWLVSRRESAEKEQG